MRRELLQMTIWLAGVGLTAAGAGLTLGVGVGLIVAGIGVGATAFFDIAVVAPETSTPECFVERCSCDARRAARARSAVAAAEWSTLTVELKNPPIHGEY